MRKKANKGVNFNRKIVDSSNDSSWNLEGAEEELERKPENEELISDSGSPPAGPHFIALVSF